MTRDAAMLAAILANPDDNALRAVYGDALQERGDPRGELIAVQLAQVTAASQRRERELIRAHGKAWMGERGTYFSDPVFDRGLFAGGVLRAADEYEPLLADPEFQAIRSIHGLHARSVLDDPRARHVRSVLRIAEADAIELADSPVRRPYRELGFQGGGERATRHPLATCRGLPALRVLELPELDERLAAIFRAAPVIERLDCLRFRVGDGVAIAADFIAALARRRGLKAIEVRLVQGRLDLGWAITLSRTVAPGPFTAVVARHASVEKVTGKVFAASCTTILGLACKTLHRLEIDSAVPMVLPTSALAELVAAVAPIEDVRVPWAMGGKAGARAGTTYIGGLDHFDAFTPLPAIWERFTGELGQVYDACAVNDRGAPALGKTPLAAIAKRAAEPATKKITLRRAGYPEMLHFERGWNQLRFIVTTPRDHEAMIAWFVSFLDLGPTMGAWLAAGPTEPDRRALDLGDHLAPWPGWVVAIPDYFTPWLPPTAVAAAGLRVVPHDDYLVIVVAKTPDAVTPARLKKVASQLVSIIDAQIDAHFDFQRVAAKVVAPLAKARGRATRPTKSSGMRVEFGRGLAVALSNRLGIRQTLTLIVGEQRYEKGDIRTKQTLRTALTKLVRAQR